MTTDAVASILARLDEIYPFGECYLRHANAWELLVATILSAQCTDRQVNALTGGLFAKYPDMRAFAEADIAEIERDITPAGFFRVKARHIQGCARALLDAGGDVPSDIEKLTALPGVGRKTANLVRGHIYGIPCIVVDTHVGRVSRRLGLAVSKDPERVEYELMDVLPKSRWIAYNQQIIAHGRAVCTARAPRCAGCPLAEWCSASVNGGAR
jgi:endonuclease-3